MKSLKLIYNSIYIRSFCSFYHNICNINFIKTIKNKELVKNFKKNYSTNTTSILPKEYKTINVDNKIRCSIVNYNEKNKFNIIKLIENEIESEKAAVEINQNDIIAVDFEGTNLGKYGKICIMQVYTEKKVVMENKKDIIIKNYYIFDLLKLSVINGVKKIIENKRTLKLVHDCREDSSALYNQLRIKFENVYDTSRAHMLIMQKRKDNDIYQVSFFQLLNEYLGIKDECLNNTKREMHKNDKIWEIRPLSKMCIIYALKSVKYLVPLYHTFNKILPKKEVLEKSKGFVNYYFLNSQYKLPSDLAKRGNIVEAMLVSKSMVTCVFKLNSTRKGIACTPSSVVLFRGVNVGDVVLCVVSNKSINQKILYLCKYDDVYDYWNLKERSRGKFKPSIHENTIDPMIRFCDEENST